MMQLGGRHTRGFGDLFDLRLIAPVAADVRDGAADDVIVGRGRGGRLEAGDTVGREHGVLHHWPSSRPRRAANPPGSCLRQWPASGRVWLRRLPPTVPRRSFRAPAATEN